jgi:hypothetical protein
MCLTLRRKYYGNWRHFSIAGELQNWFSFSAVGNFVPKECSQDTEMSVGGLMIGLQERKVRLGYEYGCQCNGR